MTFIRDFCEGTTSSVYPKHLKKLASSICGLSRSGCEIVLDVTETWVHVVGLYVSFEVSKGAGSAALDWLCGLADRHGVQLWLVPKPRSHKRLGVQALRAWYKRRGFIANGHGWWVRVPKKGRAS